MADEPRDLILPMLREMREDMNKRFDKVDENMARMGRSIEDVNMAVAALTVSNRHIRAEVSQLLAENGNFDLRIRRIEKHLGLTDA